MQVASLRARASAAERERDWLKAEWAKFQDFADYYADSLRMAHAADVEDVLEQHAAADEKLHAAHAQEVADLKEAHAAQLAALHTEHGSAVQTLQQRVACLEVRLSECVSLRLHAR